MTSYPSLAIGPLLDTHRFDIGDMLRESLEAEGAALALYLELLDLVTNASVPLEEFARQMIGVEELPILNTTLCCCRPGAWLACPSGVLIQECILSLDSVVPVTLDKTCGQGAPR